jgi:hypothetical protein
LELEEPNNISIDDSSDTDKQNSCAAENIANEPSSEKPDQFISYLEEQLKDTDVQ